MTRDSDVAPPLLWRPAMAEPVEPVLSWIREYANDHSIDLETPETFTHVRTALLAFGAFGLETPVESGGLGLDRRGSLRVLAQLASLDLSLACSVLLHQLASAPVLASPSLDARLVRDVATGRASVALALSEPGAGSNPRAMTTTALRAGDRGYHLTGHKSWCSNAARADQLVVIARTASSGTSAFLVPRDANGVEISAPIPTMGMRGLPTHEVRLRGVFVESERRLGAEGEGLALAERALSVGRLGIAAMSSGAAKRSLQWAMRFASRRRIHAGLLVDDPIFRARIAELDRAIVAVDALMERITDRVDAGDPPSGLVLDACKIAATEWLGRAHDVAMQSLGARGYSEQAPVARAMRDARMLRIGEGPTEALLAHLGGSLDADPHCLDAFLVDALGQPVLATTLSDAAGATHDPSNGELRFEWLGRLALETLVAASSAHDRIDRRDVARWTLARVTACIAEGAAPSPDDARTLVARIARYDGAVGSLSSVSARDRQTDPWLAPGDAGGDANLTVPESSRTLTPAELAQLTRFERGAALAQEATRSTVHGAIRARALAQPGSVACTCGPRRVDYSTLWSRATRLSALLARAGVRPGDLVPVCVPRGPALIESALAVLAAGAVYVPLDAASPRERLVRMLGFAHPLVLTTRSLATMAWGSPVVAHDDEREWPDAGLFVERSPEDACFVIHTSGSTGAPKRVALPHGALHAMIVSRNAVDGIGANDRVLPNSTATFDASVWELFGPLVSGSALTFVSDAELEWDPAAVSEVVRRARVTTIQLVPSQLASLLEAAAPGDLASVERVFCGGEKLSRDLASRVARETSARLYNVYGPAEATIECTWHRVDPNGRGAVAIGRPYPGRRIHVVDASLARVAPGVPGEILIAGFGVGTGYLGASEADAARFVSDPFAGESDARAYRTGDLGRFRDDGELEFLGRIDRQMKVRGIRIEPGEIEAVLLEDPAIARAVVVAPERRPGDRWIVAYVVPRADYELDEDRLRAIASARLPRTHVPSAFVILGELPLLPSGKVDQARLPPPRVSSDAVGEPGTETERAAASLFAAVLGAGGVSLDDDFFALGGDSLSAARVLAKVRAELGASVQLRALLAHPTPRWLASEIERTRGAAATTGRERLLDLVDAARNREVPVMLYLPEQRAPAPVVVFSHGLGGTRDGYRYLGRHWASRGYVSIHLQHRGSDIDVLAEAGNPMLGAMRAAADHENLLARPRDVSFVLDELARDTELSARLDLSRVAVAGHSFGAFTALACGGLNVALPGRDVVRPRDPRVRAVIALSAPATMSGALEAASYASVAVPALHVSGTRDDGPVHRFTAEERRFSFDCTPGPDQVFVLIEGAHHFTFGDNERWNGEPVVRDPEHHRLLQRATTAFLDAHLGGDGRARAWLHDAMPRELAGYAHVERK